MALVSSAVEISATAEFTAAGTGVVTGSAAHDGTAVLAAMRTAAQMKAE
jgi:hypothetical protein